MACGLGEGQSSAFAAEYVQAQLPAVGKITQKPWLFEIPRKLAGCPSLLVLPQPGILYLRNARGCPDVLKLTTWPTNRHLYEHVISIWMKSTFLM
jgi:hypothetical protein